jgi:uncharacterized membrane protein YkgB
MQHNIFLIAGVISVVFVLVKLAEARFIDKEAKPMKLLVRDSLVVYISVITGDFMLEQLQPFIATERIATTPEVFVDAPDF